MRNVRVVGSARGLVIMACILAAPAGPACLQPSKLERVVQRDDMHHLDLMELLNHHRFELVLQLLKLLEFLA